jgi:hypothetical protein
MKKTSFDPSRRLDIYLRIDRINSRTFTFTLSDGTAFPLTYEDFSLTIKSYAGSTRNVIELTIGDGLSIVGNQLMASVSVIRSDQDEGEYYWELYKPDTMQTWINGKAFFHNGEFDGVTDVGSSIVIGTEDPVQITLDQVFSVSPSEQSGISRWSFSANGGLYPTDPKILYIVTDNSVIPENTQFYAKLNTLPAVPTISDFYFK